MTTKHLLLTLALIVTILCTVGAQQTPRPQQWEYKFEYKMSEKKTNELAAQGWELVGAATDEVGPASVSFLIFKRPK